MGAVKRLPILRFIEQTALEASLLIQSPDCDFFKRLEWWLADGVFNGEPYGLFRVADGYRGPKREARTVYDFLQQETRHRWPGTNTLMDLFNQEVSEMLLSWCWNRYKTEHGADPDELTWEFIQEKWDDEIYSHRVHPESHSSVWMDFLERPLAPTIEPWRSHAHTVFEERTLVASRELARQNLELAMVERVQKAIDAKGGAPGDEISAIEGLLEGIHDDFGPGTGDLEVAVFVRSAWFSGRMQEAEDLIRRIQDRYELPELWRQGHRI